MSRNLIRSQFIVFLLFFNTIVEGGDVSEYEIQIEITDDDPTLQSLTPLDNRNKIDVVDNHGGVDWSYHMIDKSGEYSASITNNENIAIVMIGAGGGGTSARRNHRYVRTGASGASGEVELFIPSIDKLVYILNGDRVKEFYGIHFSVNTGIGGKSGAYDACDTTLSGKRFNWKTWSNVFNGSSGQDTVVKILQADDSGHIRKDVVSAHGGEGAFDHYDLRADKTCYGACSKVGVREGFVTDIPPVGGLPKINGITGMNGIDNINVVPGTTLLDRAKGGKFTNHQFGMGGHGGGYDARKGTVLNPPGPSYRHYDGNDQCQVHSEAVGSSGSNGALILVFQKMINEVYFPTISQIKQHFTNSSDTLSDSTKDVLNGLEETISGFISASNDVENLFPETIAELSKEDNKNVLAVFLNEQRMLFDSERGPEIKEAYFLGVLKNKWARKKLLALLIWASMSHEHNMPEHLRFDSEYAGISTSVLSERYNSLLMNIKIIENMFKTQPGSLTPYNLKALDKLKENVSKLRKEIRKRTKNMTKAKILERTGGYGRIPEDPNIGDGNLPNLPTEFIFPEIEPACRTGCTYEGNEKVTCTLDCN